MRKILLAIAVIAGLTLGIPGTAGAAPPAPARVTPHGGGFAFVICFPVFVFPPGTTVWRCFTIELPEQLAGDGPGSCPQCGLGVVLTYDPAELTDTSTIVSDLGQGYALLGQAAVSTDGEGPKLHAAAVNTFIATARTLGSTKLGEREVGYVDPASGFIDPPPQPFWREQAAADLITAINLLQSYLVRPSTQTLASATAALDASYKILAGNAAFVG
jgi:hypothetical protein